MSRSTGGHNYVKGSTCLLLVHIEVDGCQCAAQCCLWCLTAERQLHRSATHRQVPSGISVASAAILHDGSAKRTLQAELSSAMLTSLMFLRSISQPRLLLS